MKQPAYDSAAELWVRLSPVLLLVLGIVLLGSAWRLSIERYRVYLEEHHPEFLEKIFREGPQPEGGLSSIVHLGRIPAPDDFGESLRRRARIRRILLYGYLVSIGVLLFIFGEVLRR